MNRHLPSAVKVLVQGLVLGLTLLGGLGCLIALRLATGWGLLLLVITTGAGLLCLATSSVVRQRRVRATAARGVREAEIWLRHSRDRAEGAE